MRLLMTADAVGGVWQYATELAGSLAPLGVETVITQVGPDRQSVPADAPFRVIETDLPLDWLSDGPGPVLAAGRAVAALAAEVDADIVQLNSPALAAEAVFDRPVVVVAHGCVGTWWHAARGGEPASSLAWNLDLTRAGLIAADAVVAPSAAFAARLATVYDVPARIRVVHNGRSLPSPASDTEPSDTVFTAGRLWDEVKNTPLLDRVAGMIDVPFHAAGACCGPQGERVEPHHLRHLGWLGPDGLAERLEARPIYVSAARFEPFGLSVLEAAAAGCPLILSNIDTFRELWTGAALLVPEDDAEAFVAAIARVRADPALREHLSHTARSRAARYTPEAMAGAMAAIYADLVSPAKARVAA